MAANYSILVSELYLSLNSINTHLQSKIICLIVKLDFFLYFITLLRNLSII